MYRKFLQSILVVALALSVVEGFVVGGQRGICGKASIRQGVPARVVRSTVLHMVAADALTAEDARSMLLSAAEKRDQEPDSIIEAIRFLERERSKESGEADGETTKFNQLTTNGNWRLVFTTGDLKTQKKLGGNKISYVPIKAVQVFNADYTITNGVYLGSFPLLKFFGTFTWDEGRSRLEFTFNEVAVLGLKFPFNQGESKVQPGFTFIYLCDEYVIARGAGGGLALWLRQDSE